MSAPPAVLGPIPHSRPHLDQRDEAALRDVLASGMIAQGAVVTAFEEGVGQMLGLAPGVATASGTAALVLALRTLGVGPEREVVLPTYVCRAVWDAVVEVGARPVLCDVESDWCMTRETVAAKVGDATGAIVVVHPFGIMADVAPIAALGPPIIEDCCQALAARDGQGHAGTRGALAVLSFHATKLLTTGEGGMVVGQDPALVARARALAGADSPCSILPRLRSPMSDLQAALGISQLERYAWMLQRRREITAYYFERLKRLPIGLPDHVRSRSIFFRYPLVVREAHDPLRERFQRLGVSVRRGVDALLHRLVGVDHREFPGAEERFAHTLSIPLYPALSDDDVERIADVCVEIFRSGG